MVTSRWYAPLLLLLVGGVVGGLLVWGHLRVVSPPTFDRVVVDSVSVVEVVYDTVLYRHVEPIWIEPILVEPSDEQLDPEPRDSLYTFRDTLSGRWSAEVLGSNVKLQSLTIIDRNQTTQTKIREITPLPRWEVSLKGSLTSHSQWVGVGVSRRFGRLRLTLDGGYDPWLREPQVGLTASLRLWSE
ncbi:MAG: hypothetical protein R3Y16_01375 [Rikenellaceae bacterium]